MAIYNFKRETKVYVVRNDIKYLLDVYPDLSFSQTFNETAVQVKTLHSQFDMFENAVITKANPANFSFTVPILYQSDLNIVTQLLLDYDGTSSEATLKTADLYFEANSEVYKIEKCVIESGVFKLLESDVISLNISGTGSKLTKFTGTIPGVLQVRTIGRNFGRITALNVAIGAASQSAITSVSLEVKNNISWIDFATLQNSQSVFSAPETMVPGAFVVNSRALTGTIQQYITDANAASVNTWSTNSPILIEAGELGKSPLLRVNIPSVVFTNRLEVQDLYIQSYDFRMVSNPSSLSTIITKE